MFALNQTVFTYLNQLELWSVSHVRRELNVRADELSKIGMQEAKNSKK
jgi:ribonuclease HI